MGIGKAQRDLEIRADLTNAGGSAGDENNLSIHVSMKRARRKKRSSLNQYNEGRQRKRLRIMVKGGTAMFKNL